MGRDERWMELPPSGFCWECRKPLPVRLSGPGPRARFHKACARRRGGRLVRERLRAKRAWNGIDRAQHKPAKQIVIQRRQRRPDPSNPLVWRKVCPDCENEYYAGHRAKRCWDCTVIYNRARQRKLYLQAKFRASRRSNP